MSQQLNQNLYEALKVTAANIAKVNAQMGVYAQRKVNAVSADSDLKVLIQVGEDLAVIAKHIS